MADWLIVLSEDNWEICARKGLLGPGRDAERRLNEVSRRSDVEFKQLMYVARSRARTLLVVLETQG
jgi:hypothetical protein